MGTEREYLDGLARLHLATDADERRGLWRQSVATLAAEAADQRPVPLEGIDPQEILASVRTAISVGLLDDLDFLGASHAAAALYELAAVLPPGDEKRELGRRVAERLQQGDAATFVALATQLAVASRRGLSGPALRARVALALELPIGTGTRADALALALVSRRDLAEEWLVAPAMGSLPSRRLAARLLERASREAARRCAVGDESVLTVFDRGRVARSWARLLADREPLVWRHVATARGLLSEHVPRFADEITTDLDPELTPTQWRRAAASLAASVAVSPQKALARAMGFLAGEIPKRDPGVTSAMMLGLPRAAEAEPEAAEELCTALVRASSGIDTAEALLSLRHERVGGDFGAWACQMARATLREQGMSQSNDEGLVALAEALDEDLRPLEERARRTLRTRLDSALTAFAAESARVAYASAQAVFSEVDATIRRLEAAPLSTPEGRRDAFLALRELDGALFETSILADLLTLGARGEGSGATAPLAGYFARITEWLLTNERLPVAAGAAVPHRTLRIHRLRTLLHAVDADGSFGDVHRAELRERRMHAFDVLIGRVRDDADSPLRRVVTAAAARACDALLREEHAELSDVFLAVGREIDSIASLETMAEASMMPEMENVFRAYAGLVERTAVSTRTTGTRARASLDALNALVRSFPVATSPRVDALHDALLAFKNAIESAMACGSLSELTGEAGGGSRVVALERAVRLLMRLMAGAWRRLGKPVRDNAGVAGPALRVVDIAVERAYRGDKKPLGEAVAAALDALYDDLPAPLAEVAASALVRIMTLPAETRPGGPPRDSFAPAAPKEAPLPPWLPPSRTLGGFYVVRALGSGAVGSVFVARRAEEKKDENAQRFALKVPEYTGAAARTLSEEEFLRLFREEAGALLAIPEHENLARLVTFDAGARPKPILVMELVEGPTLERAVETATLDVTRTFGLLDGIAAGLAAMHDAGVGHLDLKPSNVILRDMDALTGHPGTAVLVDFGLAGRHLRPGCATACYGAPEIWGLLPKGHKPSPMAADVYAFGCVAFEVLTGRELVWAASDVGIVTAHLSHDGDFDGLAWLSQDPFLAPLADILAGALRQDPRMRTSIHEVRAQLADLAPGLVNLRWPLEAHAAA